eukprot:TRINITY_DN23519_c0_g1_i1.p3 TRINITY_DN23519_c0_g1~~TRINITY_DN23519_c0_g1_i1.p3  ORF type:complete len:278 (+),score=56.71 TRINITY_DN23519_c0_g1_i1:89-922(+)
MSGHALNETRPNRFLLWKHGVLEHRSERRQLREACSPARPAPREGLLTPGPRVEDVIRPDWNGPGFASPQRLASTSAATSHDSYRRLLSRKRSNLIVDDGLSSRLPADSGAAEPAGAERRRPPADSHRGCESLPPHARAAAGKVPRRPSAPPLPMTFDIPPRADIARRLPASVVRPADAPELSISLPSMSQAGSPRAGGGGCGASSPARRRCDMTRQQTKALLDSHGSVFDLTWGTRFALPVHRRKGWRHGAFGVPGGHVRSETAPARGLESPRAAA